MEGPGEGRAILTGYVTAFIKTLQCALVMVMVTFMVMGFPSTLFLRHLHKEIAMWYLLEDSYS